MLLYLSEIDLFVCLFYSFPFNDYLNRLMIDVDEMLAALNEIYSRGAYCVFKLTHIILYKKKV